MSSSESVLRSPFLSPDRFRVGMPGGGLADKRSSHVPTAEEIDALVAERARAAEVKLNREREQVFQNGLNRGLQQARQESAETIQHLTGLFSEYLKKLVNARDEWLRESVGHLVELIQKSLEKILSERAANPKTIEHSLFEAIKKLVNADRVVLRCHPEDTEFLRSALGKGYDAIARFDRIEITEDPIVGVGGCLVEAELGIVDARIEKQLSVLKGVLKESVNSAAIESVQ